MPDNQSPLDLKGVFIVQTNLIEYDDAEKIIFDIALNFKARGASPSMAELVKLVWDVAHEVVDHGAPNAVEAWARIYDKVDEKLF